MKQLFYFFVMFALLTAMKIDAQNPNLKLRFAAYPQEVTAFDVSEDGSLMAIGGNGLIQVINVFDGSTVFNERLKEGLEIDAMKINPDNSLLAILVEGRLVTLFDLNRQSILFVTDVEEGYLLPRNRSDEKLTSLDIKIDSLIRFSYSNCSLPKFSERFRFIGKRLLFFSTCFIEEFYLEEKFDKPLRAVYGEPGDFTRFNNADLDEFKIYKTRPSFINLPWFSQVNNVLQRNYKRVVFDPTLTYGYILYEQRGKWYSETWNIQTRERVSTTTEDEFSANGSLPNPVFDDVVALESDGQHLLLTVKDSSGGNFEQFSSILRIDLIQGSIESVLSFPEDETIRHVKLSTDGQFLFCLGMDVNKDLLEKFVEGNDYLDESEGRISTNFWAVDLVNLQCHKFVFPPTLQSGGIIFSRLLQQAFVCVNKSFYQIDPKNQISRPIGAFESPKVLRLEVDTTYHLWVGTTKDVLCFDLLSGRQTGYWPAPNSMAIAFFPGYSGFAATDGKNIRRLWFDRVNTYEDTLLLHKNLVSALEYHPYTGALLSGEKLGLQPWAETSQLLVTPAGKASRSLPFSSSYIYQNPLEDTEDIAERTKPVLQKGVYVFQLAQSPDGQYLAAITMAKYPIDIGKAANEVMRRSMRSGSSAMAIVNETPVDSMPLLKNPYPGEVKLWRLSNGIWKENEVLGVHNATSHDKQKRALAFSADSKYLAASINSHGPAVTVWNVETGKHVGSVGYSPEKATISTIGFHLGKIRHAKINHSINAIVFNPDGTYLISGLSDGSVKSLKRIRPADSVNYSPILRMMFDSLGPDGKMKPLYINPVSDIKFQDSIAYTYLGKNKDFLTLHNGGITAMTFTPDGRYLVTGGEDGKIIIHNFTDDSVKAIIALKSNSEGYVTSTSGNFFYAHPDGRKLVFFEQKKKTYSIDQYELFYNRPEIVRGFFASLFLQKNNPKWKRVLSAMSIDSAIVAKRFAFYQTNQAKLLRSETRPVVQILNREAVLQNQLTDLIGITLEFSTFCPSAALTAINIWVNNVPMYGSKWRLVTATNQQSPFRVYIPLSPEGNTIQVACRDKNGNESMRETVNVFSKGKSNYKKSSLHLIVLGVNTYDHVPNLQYAVKDGRNLIDLFVNNTIQRLRFDTILVDSLFEEAVTIKRVAALQKKLMQTQPGDYVILFYSGHGRQNAANDLYLGTSKMNPDNLSGTALPYRILELLLDSIPARQKILLLDACESGLTDKTKKTSSVPGADSKPIVKPSISNESIFLTMQEMFSDLNRGTGTITIAATSGYDFAQESSKWQNGAFTHCIRLGLETVAGTTNPKADLDADGSVSISELQKFLKTTLPRITQDFRKPQKPTTRTENIGNDFRVR